MVGTRKGPWCVERAREGVENGARRRWEGRREMKDVEVGAEEEGSGGMKAEVGMAMAQLDAKGFGLTGIEGFCRS